MTDFRFEDIRARLLALFHSWSGKNNATVVPLPVSGSARQYFRIKWENSSVLGAFNKNIKENIAFFDFTEYFSTKNLPVPNLLAKDSSNIFYLVEDLGDTTLLAYITKDSESLLENIRTHYPSVLDHLLEFQLIGRELDYSSAYPKAEFDQQAMMWDLNYFKYMFLKLIPIEFDEVELENDFLAFTRFLLSATLKGFVYRDFQSRNIMVRDNHFYFIDYQGGRKGHPAYDVASLLFESKTNIPEDLREELRTIYIDKLSQRVDFNRNDFTDQYYGFALLRLLQAMGAYGYRGMYENKPLFIQSIAPAISTLEYLSKKLRKKIELPHLSLCFDRIIGQKENFFLSQKESLIVTVKSFTYRKRLPLDLSGNGGGHYFDCRALPNPGRHEQYKHLTGKDKPVQDFLLNEPAFHEFISATKNIVDASVRNYRARNFKHLMVCFGCTGGQHRSVFSAETMAIHLQAAFPDITVCLKHQEIG